MKDKILVVEDEKSIADAIVYALQREGYTAEAVYNGEAALKRASEFHPDIMILDIMLPGMDGYDVLKNIQHKNRMGVIILTAKEDIISKVLGLELGADDYLTKPFDMRELLARLKSVARRMRPVEEKQELSEIVLCGVTLHILQRRVYAGECLLDLTPKEFDLLALLVSNPDRVYTRDQLLDLIWGMEYIGGTRTVDIHIQRVRKKLGAQYCDLLQTVHGIGYKASGAYSENQH